MKDMVTRPAMDAAIEATKKSVRITERGIRMALDEVKPFVGEFSTKQQMAFDSADDVYRQALVMLGVDGAKDIHASALPAVLRAQPKAGAKTRAEVRMGADEAQKSDFAKRFPGADRIGII
jgi:hypothetical protein